MTGNPNKMRLGTFSLSIYAWFLLGGSGASLHAQTNFATTGYNDLSTYLAGNVPTGSSVNITQAEAGEGSAPPYRYRIDTANAQLSGKTINFSPTMGSLSLNASGHATTVASYFSGTTYSMTPGVSRIYEMPATDLSTGYIGSDFLRYPNNFLAPLVEANDIQNHSWVHSTGNSSVDAQINSRLDYAVKRDNFVAVVGVNNANSVAEGGNPANARSLLSGAYNVISVGLSSGNHSYTDTVAPTAGRERPHLVTESYATSFSTPIVASGAALLMDGASTLFAGNATTIANARDFRTVKSLLMAGAAKDGLGAGGNHTWTATSSSQPLDAIYGAGRLNVFHSYLILESGQQNASSSANVTSSGWNFETVASASPDYYFFDLDPQDSSAFSLSISLNWAVEVAPDIFGNYNNPTLTLRDLTLTLFDATGYSLGSQVAVSNSSVENLEYLWLSSLQAGRYAMRVSSASSSLTEYGIAWQALAVPEPQGVALIVFGLTISTLVPRRQRPA